MAFDRHGETSRAGSTTVPHFPTRLRRKPGIEEGSLVMAEETGDVEHLGGLFGSAVGGVRILLPSDYLKTRPNSGKAAP